MSFGDAWDTVNNIQIKSNEKSNKHAQKAS